MAESKFSGIERRQGYDFIFAGAGCAALSLVMRMIRSGKFNDKKILLIDKETKAKNDRTWCFWERQNGFFEDIVYKKWNRLAFFSDDFSQTMNISPYEYKMIRGIDFYNHCFSEIARHGNVDIYYGDLKSWRYHKEGFTFFIDDQQLDLPDAPVFNSIYRPLENNSKTINLLQHFKGWVIETNESAFDPGIATLMDFRVLQEHGTSFVYVMPFSDTRALVEYTLFSKELLPQEDYDNGLKDYIDRFLKIKDYRVIDTEFGIIPMTTKRFDFYKNFAYNIGTAGGQTKGSSGYTFQFIQKQAQAIVDHLIQGKDLARIPRTPGRFRFYDKVLLDVLYHKRVTGKTIFTSLFKKNKPRQVLRFLDNESSLTEELKIISSLPTLQFLKAAIRQF